MQDQAVAGCPDSISVLASRLEDVVAGPGFEMLALRWGHAGVLTRFATWGIENCGHLPAEIGSDLGVVLRNIVSIIAEAVRAHNATELQSALQRLRLGDGSPPLGSRAFWQCLQTEVTEPLAAALAKAGELSPAEQARLAVEAAEALATRACAHPCCTTIVGASEAAAPRGKLCSGCRLVRYCGPRCQKADWPAHKAACREVASRRAGAGPAPA